MINNRTAEGRLRAKGQKCKSVKRRDESKQDPLKKGKTVDWGEIPIIKKLTPDEVELEPNSPESFALFRDQVRQVTGTVDHTAGIQLLLQSAQASCAYGAKDFALGCTIALALIYGIGPRDSIEGMLAAQMVATHNLAMEFLRRPLTEGQTVEQATENVNRAAKLLRLYTAQVEALGKYRNKGMQKVTVEHVHINAGGQAIVGIVGHEPEGGGGRQ